MRSRPPDRQRPRTDDDLTARAKIRDAAVQLFAAAGYRGTSIRDVARAAGVSPGLVQHHFGSKAGLREACDAHVRETLGTIAARKMEREEYDGDFMSSLYDASATVMRYVARGLTEEWPGMVAIFDQVAGDSERWLSAEWPDRFPPGSQTARTHAGVLACMSLGTLALHGHLARWAEVDTLERGHEHVRSAAMVEVIMRLAEFLDTAPGRSMRAALADFERTISPPAESDR